MAETITDTPVAAESVTKHDGGGRKQPPPEKPADVRRRTLVIASFWLIVLCLGLPIWWQTTTIHRAKLPLDEMLNWAEGRVRNSVSRGKTGDFGAPSSIAILTIGPWCVPLGLPSSLPTPDIRRGYRSTAAGGTEPRPSDPTCARRPQRLLWAPPPTPTRVARTP
jgi:hypothetical protein